MILSTGASGSDITFDRTADIVAVWPKTTIVCITTWPSCVIVDRWQWHDSWWNSWHSDSLTQDDYSMHHYMMVMCDCWQVPVAVAWQQLTAPVPRCLTKGLVCRSRLAMLLHRVLPPGCPSPRPLQPSATGSQHPQGELLFSPPGPQLTCALDAWPFSCSHAGCLLSLEVF